MKAKVIVGGLLVVLALSLFACASEATEEPVSPGVTEEPVEPTEPAEPVIEPSTYAAATSVEFYTCNDFMNQKHITDEIELTVGKGVTVILCSNPTTGFQWTEEAQISDTGVIQQVGHESVAPTSDKPGAAGTEKFTFRAFKSGTSTVSLEYSRPWEGGEKAEWTCILTITVK